MTSRHTSPTLSPLPMRDGVAASYLWLPEGQWPNLLSFLVAHFDGVPAHDWVERMAAGEVVNQHGQALHPASPFRRGDCMYYYRSLPHEEPIPVQEHVLFRDEHLLVADKPHFLPVIPSGRFLRETLLVRLKKSTGLSDLTPIHRIDRETAGVVVFSLNAQTRGRYQSLFQQKAMHKTYEAIAPAMPDARFPFVHRSRMVESEQFFRMHEVPGEANSETLIDCIETRGNNSLYRLHPVTGRRHQLRVHMAALGSPILNDQFYPVPVPVGHCDDLARPLKLLARALAFDDPLTGQRRCFESTRSLGPF